MRAALPGKPQASLQALCTASWQGNRYVVYVTGKALTILGGTDNLIQTIYHNDCDALDAVSVDERTGKIATASGNKIYVYDASCSGRNWMLQHIINVACERNTICTLSWGSSGQLLVGSRRLQLFQTVNEEKLIWTCELSSPAKLAFFSFDSTLIATTSRFDRLVKTWRQLSSGSDDVRFDCSYLIHPSTVTSIKWRKGNYGEEHGENVLYTTCADNKIRVWAIVDPHGLQMLQLLAEVDMIESIQPRNIKGSSRTDVRYAFMIDRRDFESAFAAYSHEAALDCKSDLQNHLQDVAARRPDVWVVVDREGHMSAWGCEFHGDKTRSTVEVFNVAHVDDFLVFNHPPQFGDGQNIQMSAFSNKDNADLVLLLHDFGGSIEWLQGHIQDVFAPTCVRERLKIKGVWTGHDSMVTKLVRSNTGKALMSRTESYECAVWRQGRGETVTKLSQCSLMSMSNYIHRMWLLDEGNFVAILEQQSLSIWDSRRPVASQIAKCSYYDPGKPLCLIEIPLENAKPGMKYLATVTSDSQGIVWEAHLPQDERTTMASSGPGTNDYLRRLCSFDLEHGKDLKYIIPVDPAGSPITVTKFLDLFAKDLAIAYSHSGVFRSYAVKLDAALPSVEWLTTAEVTTHIKNPALASGSSNRKIAVTDAERLGLTIWDLRGGQLEYEMHPGPGELVQDLDWSSTPNDQSILAVGFPHRVLILAQLRYDYLDHGPAWVSIREISTLDFTPHPIGDSTWLAGGGLVVGIGNQLISYDTSVAASEVFMAELSIPVHQHSMIDMWQLVTLLNGPLPVFHPQYLAQFILSGKFECVQKILASLNSSLAYFTAGDSMDKFLGISADYFFTEHGDMSLACKQSAPDESSLNGSTVAISEGVVVELNERLAQVSVPYLTSQNQIHLANIVECVALAEKHRRSMDQNAMRFYVFFRQHILLKARRSARSQGVTWREIAWAQHSNSQDILVDLVAKNYQSRILWNHAKETGMFMWLIDIDTLRIQFETMARNEYTKKDEKNPIDCSIFYMALRKKNILLGLWRAAAWHPEQASTQRFLSNNFNEPRWKTAALKNAYALLGKRRFEYAASFFLLADSLQDAVNVCANQLHDLQLAIAIARVYDGDQSKILHSLLRKKVLPLAALRGDRWLATWAFWMLGRQDLAEKALIVSLSTLPLSAILEESEDVTLQAKSFLNIDPALIILYKQLREVRSQKRQGASLIKAHMEWEFIRQTARLYDRMGCDLLALELVRNWKFPTLPVRPEKSSDERLDSRSSFKHRRSSILDETRSSTSTEPLPGAMRKPSPPVAFEEPNADSLLDSFGL